MPILKATVSASVPVNPSLCDSLSPCSCLPPPLPRSCLAGGILFCHIVTPTSWLLPQFLDLDYYPFAIIMLLGLTQVCS